MSEQKSQALEFTKVQFEISTLGDFMDTDSHRIRNINELKTVLNNIDLDDNELTIHLTGTTEDGHQAHFRFYSHPNKDRPWYWGYVSFVLDKLDSQAERLLKKVREILR